MDLHGGVGPVIPINAPPIPEDVKAQLPKWLVDVAYSPRGPEILTSQWENIEMTEKRRLESVLSSTGMESRFSISAAMEEGNKNRYTNIWPFEWNRVKVPCSDGSKDYFNGSLLREVVPGVAGRKYIATQAPLPGTFEDFWRVVWGEGVNVIVSLTAMEEGGQVCPPSNLN
jgi:tyrosine-protein phosphatase 2/3